MSATEAMLLKHKGTSGAAAQWVGATAGSPLPHSLIDQSVMPSVHHPTPYFKKKNAARYRLDDFYLLTHI